MVAQEAGRRVNVWTRDVRSDGTGESAAAAIPWGGAVDVEFHLDGLRASRKCLGIYGPASGKGGRVRGVEEGTDRVEVAQRILRLV